MTANLKTIVCPLDKRYQIELAKDQVFPDDPGSGTPAMVYGPNDSSGTYWAACDMGELACGDDVHTIPNHILRWLEKQEELVEEFLY